MFGFDFVEKLRRAIKVDRNRKSLCQRSVWYWMLQVWSAVVMAVLAEHLYWCGLMGCITFCQSTPSITHTCLHTHISLCSKVWLCPSESGLELSVLWRTGGAHLSSHTPSQLNGHGSIGNLSLSPLHVSKSSLSVSIEGDTWWRFELNVDFWSLMLQ